MSPRSNTIFCKTHTESIRKDEQHETIIEKRNKMGMDRGTKHKLQWPEKRLDNTTVSSTLQQKRRKCRYTRRMQYRIRNSAMATTKQRRIESNRICKPPPKRRREKYSVGELELLAVVWGIEQFGFYLYGKQIQLFSDHQALEPLLKRNKTNKQYSARLTRWLDRLNHFDISPKFTAGKEIKFTDFISRNPTEIAEPEETYEEEFVINAIAQLATVSSGIGRIFDQSENTNRACMHDTHTQTGTRLSKTNIIHSNLKLTANQIDNTTYSDQKTYILSETMDNNNN